MSKHRLFIIRDNRDVAGVGWYN